MDPTMKWRFISLYQMVLADGIIDAAEIDTLYRIGTETYGITPQQINEIIREAPTDSPNLSSIKDKITLLYQLGEIAWADGNIDESEVKLLKSYIINIGFNPQNAGGIADFILEQVHAKVPLSEVIKQITE